MSKISDPEIERLLGSKNLFAPSPQAPLSLENDSVDPDVIISEEEAIQALRRGGHKIKLASSFTVDWGGELEAKDYQAEAAFRFEGGKDASEAVSRTHVPRLQRIRSIHHQLAIMLAGGTKDIDAARTLGISAGRIYQLRNDPTFQELLESYKGASISDTLDAQMRSLGLGTLAMEQLMDQLLAESGDMSPSLLLKIATEMLDRAGYSPAAQARAKVGQGIPSEDQLRALKEAERAKQSGTVMLRGSTSSGSAQATEGQKDGTGA